MAEASCHGDPELGTSAPERVPLPVSVERLERARRKSEDMLPIDSEDGPAAGDLQNHLGQRGGAHGP